MTHASNLLIWSFMCNFLYVSLKYHMLSQLCRRFAQIFSMIGTLSQAHPEAGGIRSRRNEVMSEVIECKGSSMRATVASQTTVCGRVYSVRCNSYALRWRCFMRQRTLLRRWSLSCRRLARSSSRSYVQSGAGAGIQGWGLWGHVIHTFQIE